MKRKCMRKLGKLSLVLVLVLGMAFSAAGCGNSGGSAEQKEEKKTEEKKESSEKKSKEKDLTIDETVLVDWEGLKVTATSIENDEYSKEPAIKLLIENDTEYGISIAVSKLFVNGCYMPDAYFGVNLCDVPTGKKANETLPLNPSSDEFLKKAGIDTVGSVDVEFTVRDSSKDYYDDSSVLYTSDVANIQTSAYDNMDTDAIAEGTELYNQNGVRIVAKELSAFSSMDYGLYLYVENTTDMDIILQSYDVSVDGFVPEEGGDMNSFEIPAGTYSVDALVIWYDETVPDESAVEDVKEMQLGLKIFDAANWFYGYDDEGLIADTGMLTYTP